MLVVASVPTHGVEIKVHPVVLALEAWLAILTELKLVLWSCVGASVNSLVLSL